MPYKTGEVTKALRIQWDMRINTIIIKSRTFTSVSLSGSHSRAAGNKHSSFKLSRVNTFGFKTRRKIINHVRQRLTDTNLNAAVGRDDS